MTEALAQLRLLGTPAAFVGDAALRFPDRKGLALLAVLALDGDTGRAPLATLLWDESDSDVRRNLRRTLHRLREAGFEALLQTDADVLRLRPGVQHDVQAVAQWGDTPPPPQQRPQLLPGLEGSGAWAAWLGRQRERIDQAWRHAVESRLKSCEAQGDTRQALGWALALVRADPLQEGHCVRAMALHAQLGEREAALALYEQCRKALASELGLRPLASTVAMAEALRSGSGADTPRETTASKQPSSAARVTALTSAPTSEPSTGPTRSPTPLWLPSTIPMVGREADLQRILAALAEGRLVLLQAPAGTGKSRLVQALAAQPSWRTRIHECRPGDRRVPFAALTRWLRARAPSGAAQQLSPWVRAEIARLLPEWGEAGSEMTSAAQRLRLFEAVREVWQAWDVAQALSSSQPCPTLEVFEDWHFVDEASAQWWLWWRGQLGESPSERACLVCQRFADPGAIPEATQALDVAMQEAPSLRHRLASLGPEQVLDLVSQLSGVPKPQRFAQRLWQATGGLPLYLLETLRHLLQTGLVQLDAQGRWATPYDQHTEDYAELPIAPSVQAALTQRLQALDEPTQRLLQAACVADEDVDLYELCATSGLDESLALPALEQALRARVLSRGGRTGFYRFEHEVFAQALQATLLPERTRLLHRAWAQRLEATGGSAARVAAHHEGAQDKAAAIDWHLRALVQARQRQARAAQELHAQRLLELGAEGPARVHALLSQAWALWLRAQTEEAHGALAAARAAVQPQHPAALRVGVLSAHAHFCMWRGASDEPLAELERAIAEAGWSADETAQLRVALSTCLRSLGRHAESETQLQQALAMMGGEDSSLRASALDDLSRSLLHQMKGVEAAQAAELAIETARRADNRTIEASANMLLGVAHMHQGQLEEAIAPLQRCRELAAREGLVSAHRGAILNLVSVFLALGKRSEALAAVEEGYALSRQFTSTAEEQAFVEARYQCRVDTGDLGGAYEIRGNLLRLSRGANDAHRLVSGLNVAFDMPMSLGDGSDLEALSDEMLALPAANLSELGGIVQAKAAWWALDQNKLGRAGELLDAAEAVHAERPEAQAYIVALRCRWHSAMGDLAAARRVRDGLRSEGVSAEVWALALSLVLATPGPAASWEAAAEDALASGAPPPLSELLLLEALTARSSGERWRVRTTALAQRLHQSLASAPAAQAHFERRFSAFLA